jgi:hypothetical protein
MKNTMRKAFLFLVLTLIAATGAFAQKVGDTTQMGGKTYRVDSVTTDTVVLKLVPPLSAPAGLKGSGGSTQGGFGIVQMSWNRMPDVVGFNVYQQKNGSWVKVSTTKVGSGAGQGFAWDTNFDDYVKSEGRPSRNTSYSFRVTALDSNGNESPPSATFTVSTK